MYTHIFALTYEIFVVGYRNPNPYRLQRLICKFLTFFSQCVGVESRNDGENLKAFAIYFPFIILVLMSFDRPTDY